MSKIRPLAKIFHFTLGHEVVPLVLCSQDLCSPNLNPPVPQDAFSPSLTTYNCVPVCMPLGLFACVKLFVSFCIACLSEYLYIYSNCVSTCTIFVSLSVYVAFSV